MGADWTKKKGVITGKEAQRRAGQAARKDQFRQAKRGKAVAPGYQVAHSGCLLALVLAPVLAVRRWLA